MTDNEINDHYFAEKEVHRPGITTACGLDIYRAGWRACEKHAAQLAEEERRFDAWFRARTEHLCPAPLVAAGGELHRQLAWDAWQAARQEPPLPAAPH